MSKTRGPRVTLQQIETIIEFVGQHTIMLSGKTHPLNTKEIALLWQEIAVTLNSLKGPKKSSEDWKRFFIELKSKTRKKARDIAASITQTGDGGDPKKLTDIEERLIALTGQVANDGAQDVPAELDPEEADCDADPSHFQEPTKNEHVLMVMEYEDVITSETDGVNDFLILPQDINEKQHIEVNKTPQSTYKPKRNFKKTKTSSVGVLEQSAKIYAESADKISTAINNFADSVNNLANSIRFYTERAYELDATEGN